MAGTQTVLPGRSGENLRWSRVRKSVILAAGRGTRLRPATKAQPKEMLPVGRQPVIGHVRDELALFGVDSILIVTGREKRAIEDHFDGTDDEDTNGPRIFYVRQSVPRGTADAIAIAEDYAGGEPFIVALGDTIMGVDPREDLLHRMERAFIDLRADVAIAVQAVPPDAVSRYGIVAPKIPLPNNGVGAVEPFLVSDLVEKPPLEEAPSRLAIAARYIFSPVIFDYIRRTPPAANGELQSTDAMRLLLREGGTICCVPARPGQERHDVGNFENYYEAFITFAMGDEELGPNVRRLVRDRLREWSD